MAGDSHFPLRVETENPRQKPEAGTETFIYKIKMSAKVSNFQPHHQILYHNPSRVWKTNFTYSTTLSQIKVHVYFLFK